LGVRNDSYDFRLLKMLRKSMFLTRASMFRHKVFAPILIVKTTIYICVSGFSHIWAHHVCLRTYLCFWLILHTQESKIFYLINVNKTHNGFGNEKKVKVLLLSDRIAYYYIWIINIPINEPTHRNTHPRPILARTHKIHKWSMTEAELRVRK
jgi:hypothetical protein